MDHELKNNIKLISLAAIALLTIAYGLYSQSFGNAWTYDDFPVVVDNPDIRSWSLFLKDSYGGRPLRELTYLLDYQFFGLSPKGYHVQSIFWHALNAILLFVLILRLNGSRIMAWGAALLFLVHPLQVEVVANISHRKDSLALAFSLLAILAYQQVFASQKKWSWLWLLPTALLTYCAYLGKQNAIALLPMYIAFELAFVPRERRLLARYPRVLIAAVPVGIAWALYWYFSGGRDGYLRGAQFLLSKMNYYGTIDEWTYGLMLIKSWGFMFMKTLLPFNLALEYTYSVPTTLLDPWVLAGLVILGMYVFGLWYFYKTSPGIFFALAWIGAFWVPVSNVWPLAYFAADRYLYAPLAAVAVIIVAMILLILRQQKYLLWTGLGCYVAFLSYLSWEQNKVWKDEFALWTQAVEVSPDSSYALNNLGAMYGNWGKIDIALKLIGKAAENPFYLDAQVNMARIYERLGQKEKAVYYRKRAADPHAMSTLRTQKNP